MKIGLTIEARMNSSRLPGKMLLPMSNRSVLACVIERMKLVSGVDEVVVASTSNILDDKIEEECLKYDTECFRGSESDITDRLLNLANSYNFDVIVQMWGDCLLQDPAVIEKGIRVFKESNFEFLHNRTPSTYPKGQEVHIFTKNVLQKIATSTTDPEYREHGTSYVFDHQDEFNIGYFKSDKPEYSKYTWLLDNPNDYDRLAKLYESAYAISPKFTTENVISIIENSI